MSEIRIKYVVDSSELQEALSYVERIEDTMDRIEASIERIEKKGYGEKAKEAMRLWPLITRN